MADISSSVGEGDDAAERHTPPLSKISACSLIFFELAAVPAKLVRRVVLIKPRCRELLRVRRAALKVIWYDDGVVYFAVERRRNNIILAAFGRCAVEYP